MIKITLAPNVHSEPPTRPLPDYISEVQCYAHSLKRIGGPTHRLLIEAGAVKEGDRCDGKACRDEIPALALFGADMISMDEPLVAAIKPFGPDGFAWEHGHCVGKDEAPMICELVSMYQQVARRHGLAVNWIESSQQHPMRWILNHMAACELPDRVTWDWNPLAQPADLMRDDMRLARKWCDERDIDMACIIMAHPPHDHVWPELPGLRDSLWFSYAWKHWQELWKACRWDRVVVQSWTPEQDKTIPSTDTLIGFSAHVQWFDERGQQP